MGRSDSKKNSKQIRILSFVLILMSALLVGMTLNQFLNDRPQIGYLSKLNLNGEVENLGINHSENLEVVIRNEKQIRIQEKGQKKKLNSTSLKRSNQSYKMLSDSNIENAIKENPNIIGWLEIAELGISEPIMKDVNDFYQTHNSTNVEDPAGSVYSTIFNLDNAITKVYGKAWNRQALLGPIARLLINKKTSIIAYVLDDKDQIHHYRLLGVKEYNKNPELASFTEINEEFNLWAEEYYLSYDNYYRYDGFKHNKKILFVIAQDSKFKSEKNVVAYFQEV